MVVKIKKEGQLGTLKRLTALLTLMLAFDTPSYAQVEIYGLVNATAESISGSGVRKNERMTDSGSFIGFRGNKDLGDGTKVYFVLQQLFDISGGSGPIAVPSNGFTDQSFIGLQGPLGQLQLGYFPIHNPASIFKWDNAAMNMGLASSLLPIVHGNGQTFGSTAGGRLKNMIQYTTPVYTGIQAAFFYGKPDETILPNGQSGKAYGVTGTYSVGPLMFLYSHINQVNTNTSVAVSGFNVKGDRLIANYNQESGFSGSLVLDRNKNDDPLLGSGLTRHVVAVPIWYKTSRHTVSATYAKASDVKGISNSGATFAMAGYSYSLSKRTNIYVDIANIRNDANAHYDFQLQASVAGFSGPPNFRLQLPGGADPKIIQIGIRHAF